MIYNENCISGMNRISDKSVDMVLCDLPYGCTANKADVRIPFDPLWEQYERVCKDNAAIVLFGSGLFTADLQHSKREWWRYNLIWQKTTPTGFLNANRMPLRAHEDICVFYKKPPTYNPQKTDGHTRKVSTADDKRNCKESINYNKHNLHGYDSTERFPTSVLRFPTDKQQCSLHPTQKPVALCEWLIRTYTNRGDTVLDNCMGSGTTAIAAIKTGRQYIGFEIDPHYYSVCLKRIQEAAKMPDKMEGIK